ncbi:MAG: ribonuclease T [Sphingomonas fennica]
MKPVAAAVIALLAALPAAVQAQARECRVPADLPRAHVEGPTAEEPMRQMPIARYTLAVSWSPHYCRPRAGRPTPDSFQCSGDFGFTLHGLWPDGVGQTWPQYCQPAALVPDRVVRETLCATPDVQLIQHEYAKHGTCMGVSPAAYFSRSTALYRDLRFPDMARLARRTQTVRSVTRAFAAANPGMRADMLRLNLDRQGWLSEVWICLDTAFKREKCPAGGPRQTTKVRIRPAVPAAA